VIQTLIAVGDNPAGDDWAVNGNTPLDALAALQQESGGFAWQAAVPGENFLATAQAVPALEGKSFLDVVGTVDVGEAMPPSELPATGGALPWGALLAVAGLALSGVGLALRRR
jgi:hypothetical protein